MVSSTLTGMSIDELLTAAVSRDASDLHLKVGARPMVRVVGALEPLVDDLILTAGMIAAIVQDILPEGQRDAFRQTREADFAYTVPQVGRFRCNAFQQRETLGIVFRAIPMQVDTIENLQLPPVLNRIALEERGLVLVTGTTGSGKSTTLASMIRQINTQRCCHVITVEDPIEFLHEDARSIVNQREVAVDTESFAAALRSGLRQDPDVILVGEMRDFETIETALLAAETGHLVLSTLHTLDATETINRIIAVFPPHQQKQVRLQLASVLRAVISQRLLPRADGTARVPACEVLVSTPFVRTCIVDKEKTHLIREAIASGTSQYGMQTFDQSIFSLYQQGLVSQEEALRWASNADDFKLKMQGISTTSAHARDLMSDTDNLAPAGEPLLDGIERFGS